MALRLSSVRQHAGALEEHLCAFRYVYATQRRGSNNTPCSPQVEEEEDRDLHVPRTEIIKWWAF